MCHSTDTNQENEKELGANDRRFILSVCHLFQC